MAPLRVGILTSSDACSRGEREDESGELIANWCRERRFSIVRRETVPDQVEVIAARLTSWADSGRVDVLLTTGGTGFSPRDVTPEATLAVTDRLAPGVAEAMRRRGEEVTPTAILSRGVVGSRGAVFIANLPGSPGGVKDGLAVLRPLIEHIVALLRGEAASHPIPSD